MNLTIDGGRVLKTIARDLPNSLSLTKFLDVAGLDACLGASSFTAAINCLASGVSLFGAKNELFV